MFKYVLAFCLCFALINAQEVSVSWRFGNDSTCAVEGALAAVWTLPEVACAAANCTDLETAFYETVACFESEAAVPLPETWITVRTFGADDTCAAASSTGGVAALSGACFPALDGYATLTCVDGEVHAHICQDGCGGEVCLDQTLANNCSTTQGLGYAIATCPAAAPVAAPVTASPVAEGPVAEGPVAGPAAPVASPIGGVPTRTPTRPVNPPNSAASVGASILTVAAVALILA